MNDIPAKQNSDHALWLMRARQRTYALATALQIAQLFATVLAPVALSVVAINVPGLRAHLACTSLVLLLIDIFVLDRLQLKLLRRAAKIAEQFDCEVLQLPWNAFIAGKPLEAEDVHAAAVAYSGGERALARLRDWYPIAAGRAPLHVGRIVCQATNMRYDAKLRKRYAAVVSVLPLFVAFMAIVGWGTLDLSFAAVVLAILTPATPVVVWSLREMFRHRDAAAAQDAVRETVDRLWANIAQEGAENLTRRAREFQDAIFQRRVASPLVLPLVYHIMRDRMEEQMHRGAEERLAQIGY